MLGAMKAYLRAQENHAKGKGLYHTFSPSDNRWQSARVLHHEPFPRRRFQVLPVPGQMPFLPRAAVWGCLKSEAETAPKLSGPTGNPLHKHYFFLKRSFSCTEIYDEVSPHLSDKTVHCSSKHRNNYSASHY